MGDIRYVALDVVEDRRDVVEHGRAPAKHAINSHFDRCLVAGGDLGASRDGEQQSCVSLGIVSLGRVGGTYPRGAKIGNSF